ncbi:MAG: hypothetical protein MRZ90_00340 [Candidatus Gastranaerophilales bacterium]|nr:hypothetical protein [Candidatus Gastranaerophilales bacterium]
MDLVNVICKINPRWWMKTICYMRGSPSYKTLVAAKLGLFFVFLPKSFVSPTSFYARGLKPPCNPVELYNFSYGEQATKHLFGLQSYNQIKVNRRWWMKASC